MSEFKRGRAPSGNGGVFDEGLAAIREAFMGATYLEPAAEECAELLMAGKHRELELPDAAAMEMYGTVTEGKNFEVQRLNKDGAGYMAHIESYTDLAAFFRGDILTAKI